MNGNTFYMVQTTTGYTGYIYQITLCHKTSRAVLEKILWTSNITINVYHITWWSERYDTVSATASGTESLVFIEDNDMTTLCSDSAVAVKLITLNFAAEMESILR